eukprot:2389642-Rhodomonas_salina.7
MVLAGIGTEIGYGASRHGSPVKHLLEQNSGGVVQLPYSPTCSPVLTYATLLREVRYWDTRCPILTCATLRRNLRAYSMTCGTWYALLPAYALPRTDAAYAATRSLRFVPY